MTNWQLYTQNENGWQAMLSACELATKSIDLEQFIFLRDPIGEKFIEVCTRKAQEGVKVRFLWDAAGSFTFFGTSNAENLRKKGIELVFFKSLIPQFKKLHKIESYFFRNHRRSLIIDDKIAFTGSICISNKTLLWRDTIVRVEGNVVKEIKILFEKMWSRAKKGRVFRNISLDSTRTGQEDFIYVANSPVPGRGYLLRHIIRKIREAKASIYITTPYFVPTRHLARTIRQAARRGIDVRIIIPEWTDHPVVDLAARTYFHNMLKAGVKIFLYKGQMLHAKTMIIDDVWSTIGTLNLDHVSLLYNYEANIISTNINFAKEILTHFNEDLKKCEEMTFEKWQNGYTLLKFVGFFIRFFRPFL
jgi:cardiolipin synthase A/B